MLRSVSTVYSCAAVAAIYMTKSRPRFNPLIVHVASLEAAFKLARFPESALKLAHAFWPGPLTLVLPALLGNGIADLATAGLPTIALRVPRHPVARALILAAGCPLAAPSANRSGRISPTQAAHVAIDFGDDLALILDGGAAVHGIESTIVACGAARAGDACGAVMLLRPGAISAADIAAVIGARVTRVAADPDAPSAPGQLASHYAPRAHVRLNAVEAFAGEALLAFGPSPPPSAGPTINLSREGDLIEAAQNLFAALRALDARGAGTIAVMPIPDHGLGEAINDRLARAAAPR